MVEGFTQVVESSSRRIRRARAESPVMHDASLLDRRPAVERSDRFAATLLEVLGQFEPEAAGRLGIEGVDERVTDFALEPQEYRAALACAVASLERLEASESDAFVRGDLQIMREAARLRIRASELSERFELPYVNVGQCVFEGVRALLDDQVAPMRRRSARVRLRRYAGLELGSAPATVAAEGRLRAALARDGLEAPYRPQLERDLQNSSTVIAGIGALFARFSIDGYDREFEVLRAQLLAYDAFVREELLPRARADFRLRPELYAHALAEYGVDIPPAELAQEARAEFAAIRADMETLAPRVARERGWAPMPYTELIARLREEQIPGDAMLEVYRERLQALETIVRRERLLTLPRRDARIRLATAAESAHVPAPQMKPPRLIGNSGETGEFVLPLAAPAESGSGTARMLDFTFHAVTWPLTAHEARPGHELQFASMVENGVSLARAIFANNTANVEGWGLYAEWLVQPFLPLDGQLVTLQTRLWRAARAFLDPELQAGTISRDEALRVLTQEVAITAPVATVEVQRYTFILPGQATAYYYGFMRLREIRREFERRMQPRFDQQQFHDRLLAQGLVDPAHLREALLAELPVR